MIYLIRADNWWPYKLPPLLSIAYALILVEEINPITTSLTVLGIIMGLSGLGAFGHIINDIFDIEEDQKAEKPNRMSTLPKWKRMALLVLSILFGFTPWFFINFGSLAFFYLLISFSFPATYSIPPFRVKDRWILGPLWDASGAVGFPALFISSAILNLGAPSSDASLTLSALFSIWALVFGVRGILVHQIWHYNQDKRAGAKTLAGRLGASLVQRIIRYFLFPFEIGTMGGIALVFYGYSPWILYLLLSYVLFDLLRKITASDSLIDPAPLTKGTYIPPTDFYEVWLPLAFIGVLIGVDVRFFLLLAIHFVLFFTRIKQHGEQILYGLGRLSQKIYRTQ